MRITRRKPTAECFNGVKFERPVKEQNCECTKANYGCEMGFTRDVSTGEEAFDFTKQYEGRSPTVLF
jgi:hypothetical protein